MQVGTRCGLVWQNELLNEITVGIDNRNYKWQSEMDASDRQTLNSLLGHFLDELGY